MNLVDGLIYRDLKLLGGLLVKIRGIDKEGKSRISKQLACIAEEVTKIFLSKQASEDLVIISGTFPTIGAYSVEKYAYRVTTHIEASNTVENKIDFIKIMK